MVLFREFSLSLTKEIRAALIDIMVLADIRLF